MRPGHDIRATGHSACRSQEAGPALGLSARGQGWREASFHEESAAVTLTGYLSCTYISSVGLANHSQGCEFCCICKVSRLLHLDTFQTAYSLDLTARSHALLVNARACKSLMEHVKQPSSIGPV